MTLVVGPEAARDLREARDHYQAIDPALARALGEEFDRVAERLEMFPGSGTPVEGLAGMRRARLRRFPYGAFYRLVSSDEIRIVRVLHSHRDTTTVLAD
ncbi:MAG: type II toxin-antitoxin system RelE/ParE family toxin [Nocardioides sp.]|uniref:type II toxin-antitoxin system RelE/ParE family toxin n=1 Tax=Nocardioides sp. TaxID=35761 RepID=UPI003267525A